MSASALEKALAYAPRTALTRALTRVQREAWAAVPDEDAVLRKRLFEARRKAMQCSAVRSPAVVPDAEPDADEEGGETTDTKTEVEADGQKARVP